MSLTALGADAIAEQLYRYERVHTALPSPAAIDEAAIAHYHEHGYLAVENVFSADDVAAYRQAIADLIVEGDPRVVLFEEAGKDKSLSAEQREAFVRKCYPIVAHHPSFAAMSRHPVLTGIVEKLIGQQVRLLQDMALLKPPRVGREKPWHQDMAYFNISPPELAIGTWTALDPATPENGCMHVIPGSHKLGPIPHYHDRDCQLADEDVDVDRDVMVPLQPGGVLFFSALIHHGTPPNRSTARRRAVQLHYCAQTCRTIGIPEHEQMFKDSVGYAGCAGWHFNSHPPRPVTSKPENF